MVPLSFGFSFSMEERVKPLKNFSCLYPTTCHALGNET